MAVIMVSEELLCGILQEKLQLPNPVTKILFIPHMKIVEITTVLDGFGGKELVKTNHICTPGGIKTVCSGLNPSPKFEHVEQ